VRLNPQTTHDRIARAGQELGIEQDIFKAQCTSPALVTSGVKRPYSVSSII